MPGKRYQVFLSSTYSDLIVERAEVMQALLELDCMPAGMELFPAASEEAWEWIKRVISESDYYVVVLGGRYGTLSERTKISYTEMEYLMTAAGFTSLAVSLALRPRKLPECASDFVSHSSPTSGCS